MAIYGLQNSVMGARGGGVPHDICAVDLSKGYDVLSRSYCTEIDDLRVAAQITAASLPVFENNINKLVSNRVIGSLIKRCPPPGLQSAWLFFDLSAAAQILSEKHCNPNGHPVVDVRRSLFGALILILISRCSQR